MIILKNKDGKQLKHTQLRDFYNKKKIREEFYEVKSENKGSKIYCDCQVSNGKEIIPLVIVQKTNIFLQNANNSGHKHTKSCLMYRENGKNGSYFKGLEERESEDGDLEIHIRPAGDMFEFKEKQIKEEDKKDNSPDVIRKSKRNPVLNKYGRLSLFSLSTQLLLRTHERIAKYERRNAENIEEVLRLMYGQAKKIFLGKQKNLQDMYYPMSWAKRNKVTPDNFVFVTGQFYGIEKSTYGNTGKTIKNTFDLLFTNGRKNKNNRININKIQVKKNVLYQALEHYASTTSNYTKGTKAFEELLNIPPDTLVLGFAKRVPSKSSYAIFEMTSLCFLSVTSFGLWVESSYERLVFERLYKEKIPFFKPYLIPEYYGGKIPDIEFIRPLNEGKYYIGEIFGIEGSDKYDEGIQEKLKMANHSDIFDLWYWKVNEQNNKIKPFY